MSATIAYQLEQILDVLKQNGRQMSVDEINRSMHSPISVRTLQRRLEQLKATGKINTSGNGRAKIYSVAGAISNDVQTASGLIPLSTNSNEIFSLVTLPIQQRQPIGYNRTLLEKYQPNKDQYLTGDEIKMLTELGRIATQAQPAGTYAKDIMSRLLIDLSWNSSRLEGNTYSLLDTERLIELGEPTDSKSFAEAQMILNHKDAIEFIVQGSKDIGFNRYTILNLHALLSNNLLPNANASGRLRSIAVNIGQSVYTPLAIPQLIEELFELMLTKATQIKNPFEQAFFIMVHLPYLQPFDDVNKRVSRLSANISLSRHQLAPLSFVDVPDDLYIQGIKGVYELNRIDLLKDVFMWAYQRSASRYAVIRQSLGEPDLLRMKYRNEIRRVIAGVVSAAMSMQAASVYVYNAGKEISENDRAKFIEIVETELMNLHDGNFARYYISPSEFDSWKKAWSSRSGI